MPEIDGVKAPGHLISIEGGEGAGKTTLVQSLAERLRAENCEILAVREPGSTQLGEGLRDLILEHSSPPLTADTELALMFCARQRLLQESCLSALQGGQVVLYDRYLDSSYAYQVCAGGADEDLMQQLMQAMQIPLPDMTLLLDLSPQQGRERHGRTEGTKDSFESRSEEFLQRVRRGFLLRAEQYPERIQVLDASQSFDEVLQQALRHCRSLLNL